MSEIKLKSIQNTNDDALYTPREAGALLGVSSQCIRLWIKKGRIQPVRIGAQLYVTGASIKAAVDLGM